MAAELDRVDHVDGQVPLPGMPDDGVLFHVERGPGEKPLSYGRRLTLRQKADVERGIHPLTHGKALPNLGTCGGCVHRVLLRWHDRRWPKCELTEMTHGAGSDCRAWWPACSRFEPGDRISDDAARWTPDHADRAEARA